VRDLGFTGPDGQLVLSAMARAVTAPRDSAESNTVPRVGYLVYRVERHLIGVSTPEYVMSRCDRSVDRTQADMLGDLAPETVEMLLGALGPGAHSLQVTNPSPRPRPPGGTR
jgi:hypothetical protein